MILHNCSCTIVPIPRIARKKSALRILNTAVIGNIGAGLAIIVNSKYNKFNIEIDRVIFNENNSTLGFQNHTEFKRAEQLVDTIGALLIMGISSEVCSRRKVDCENIMIKVSNTVVTRNPGGGVVITIINNCTTCKWNIEISQVTFAENIKGITSSGLQLGGNLLVIITGIRVSTTPTHSLRISNCVFQSGVAMFGGGACIMGVFFVVSFEDKMNEMDVNIAQSLHW